MHLQDEARASPLLPQPLVDAHHRHLDDVGVRALHDEVDREPLAERARLAVRGAELLNRPAPADQARRVAVALGLLDRPRMKSCTCGKRARYASMYACASSRGISRFSERPNDEMP